MKTLVLYYTLTGKTELVAKEIAKILDADLKKIEEIKKRNKFLVYFTGSFQALMNKCSKIKPVDINLENYELIFLGSPVWAGKPAPAINAFISEVDFKDRKLVPFFTLGSKSNEKPAKVIGNKIKSKGGNVINSFVIQTHRTEEKEIIKKTKELVKQYQG